MNKKLIFPILFFVLILVPLSTALAASLPQSVKDILDRIVTAAYTIFGLAATVCFMYAGILFATAGGETEKISKAKSALVWGIGGAILGVISASIMPILSGWLTGT